MIDLGDAVPTYATKPTPGARNDLAQIRAIAHALGTPLMPWQEYVARVASERDPFGNYRFKMVILTVPRQSGKTTLMRTVLTQRALMNPGRRAFYTAQTGKDAAARWTDLASAVDNGPLRGHITKRLAIGSQALIFPNGSTVAPFAPTPKSLHGYTPHDVMLDEIFAFDAAQGEALMGAIGPAQVTIDSRQLWLVSTMGTADSTFLHQWVDDGRKLVDDPTSTIAYFEWSMRPETADPYDETNWTFHPALNHTIGLDTLRALVPQHTRGEWLRAFMNVRSMTRETVIAPETVEAAHKTQKPPKSTRDVSIAFEVARNRSRAAIWAAWMDGKDVRTRVVQSEPGTDWLIPALVELREKWKPRHVGADRGAAPTRDILDAIQRDYPAFEYVVLGTNDFSTACDAFTARFEAGTITWEGVGLATSLEAAVTKPMGQGWVWDRVKSRGPIPDLVAATVAVRLAERAPAPLPQPHIYVPA